MEAKTVTISKFNLIKEYIHMNKILNAFRLLSNNPNNNDEIVVITKEQLSDIELLVMHPGRRNFSTG